MKYIKKTLDEKTPIRVTDFLTERFLGRYIYDEYILNTVELVLYENKIEVFRIKLNEISCFSGSNLEI